MRSQAQYLSHSHAIALAEVAFLLASVALPLCAQNSVPATAVQAARTPQFASRLAHPAGRPASPPTTALGRQRSRSGAPEGTIYDNGPINGTTDAWTINFGFVISDTFTTGGGSVDGMTFGAWLYPGDTLTSAQLVISSNPNNGGTIYSNQTVTFTQEGCTGNQFGFNVCTVSTSFTGPTLNSGTYWVNLQNASVPTGDPVYWDENSGVGCESNGCPSQAYDNSVGTIPSESFQISGSNGQPECFEPRGNLQTLFNFTSQDGGPNNITIDKAGNLYGTSPTSGDNSAGFAFKLARLSGWLLDPLFSFFGGNTGGQPTGVIVGPNGSLYGGAQGGIQNCGGDGSQYCGLVYNLTPQPVACRTALCGWNESVPYRFTSESDGSGEINVSASDREGNLYGTTTTGGTSDAGTVFQLTPSTGGSWTKSILYSFTGLNDGATPTEVLVGNDGNLYGVTNGGGISSNGVVFELTPSGGQWTETVLHAFNGNDGSQPGYLVQDSAGNLYGIANALRDGELFVLQKSSGWAFSQYLANHSCQPEDLPYDSFYTLTIDAGGNLYGTGSGGQEYSRLHKRPPGGGECFYNYIFKASYDSSGWHYQDIDFFLNTYFPAGNSLAVDTSGNLYGVTVVCGTNNAGTVWQVSP